MFKSLLFVLLSGKESPEEDKDMEENAALKIQAAFRGHLAREEVKKMKSIDLEEEKTEENKWGDWLYPTENKKKIQIHQPCFDCPFFLVSEIWCHEITFVAVVKNLSWAFV